MVYELRTGAYLNDNNRVYGTYSYNADDFTAQQSLLVSYDYLVGLDANNKFNWFIGATAGMNHVSPDAAEYGSKNRFVWGEQTGFMYKINDKVSTEIGYRYLKQDFDASATYGEPTPMPTGFTEQVSLNDSQQFYLSVDYRFKHPSQLKLLLKGAFFFLNPIALNHYSNAQPNQSNTLAISKTSGTVGALIPSK